MHRYLRIPLFFLLIAGLIGLLLRWQLIRPFPEIVFSNFLHAHSHMMFLGWVCNALLLGYLVYFVPEEQHRPLKTVFIFLQVTLIGMLVAFPIQGYGLFSIVFSTLHTFGVFVFAYRFFRIVQAFKYASVWFASVSLIFFVVSSAGPFALGYTMASGIGKTQAYYFSVYYYLHFQYNGFFTLGVLSLLFRLLEERQLLFDRVAAIRAGKWIAFSVVPAYALSVLWAEPGIIFNLIGLLAALAQIVALYQLFVVLKPLSANVRRVFPRTPRYLLVIVVAGFTLKILLQLASAHPVVAQMAYTWRPLMMAYLHLFLAGVVSLFLMIWHLETGIIARRSAVRMIGLFVAGLAGSEVALVLQPWWYAWFGHTVFLPAHVVFAFSVLMVMGMAGLWGSALRHRLNH